jgi:hypothetical protein
MCRRKRCPFCHELFWPDQRTKARQWSCSKPQCQAERRKQTQKRWRDKHPDDAIARRFRAAMAAAKAGEKPAVPRPPPPRIEAFPWEEARDEISTQVFVTLRFFAHFAAAFARDVIRVEMPKITTEIRQQLFGGVEDQTARAPPAV